MDEAIEVMDDCGVTPCSGAGVYMEFEAELSPKGNHGHLGMYQREVTPTFVHYVAGVGPDQCSVVPDEPWEMDHILGENAP